MRRGTLFGFKWPVHTHVLVNAFFPWKGEGGMCYISHMCGLKKGRFFFRQSVSAFSPNVIWWCLDVDLIKTVSLFSSKELELLGLLYGLFQQFISFDQRWVHSMVILVWVLRFNTNLRSFSNGHYSQTPLYRHLIITGIVLFPWGKKALIFSLLTV